LLGYFMGYIALVRCALVLRYGLVSWCGIRMQAEAQSNTTHEVTQQISRKLLRMDVLTSETC